MLKFKTNTLYRNKTSAFLKDVDTENALVSGKISFGEKH